MSEIPELRLAFARQFNDFLVGHENKQILSLSLAAAVTAAGNLNIDLDLFIRIVRAGWAGHEADKTQRVATPGPHKTPPICNHQWDGPRIPFGESSSVATCSLCGEAALDLRLLGTDVTEGGTLTRCEDCRGMIPVDPHEPDGHAHDRPPRAETPVQRETAERTSTEVTSEEQANTGE